MTVNTLGGDFASGRTRAAAWLPPLVPIAIATFALSALVSYHLRADGGGESRSALQWLIIGIYEFVGFVPSFMFFVLVLSWSSIWFVTGRLDRPGTLLLRVAGFALALAIWINLPGDGLPHSGALGAWIGGRMVSALGTFLSMLLAAPLTLVSLFLATDFFFVSYFEGRGRRRDDDDEAAPARESGVEADVTEQFKTLSRVFAPARPSAAAAAPVLSPTPVLGDLVALDDLEQAVADFEGTAPHGAATLVRPGSTASAAGDGDADVDADAESAAASPPPRRLSHFERRQLAAEAAASAAATGDDGDDSDDGGRESEAAEPAVAAEVDAAAASSFESALAAAAADEFDDEADDEAEAEADDEADEDAEADAEADEDADEPPPTARDAADDAEDDEIGGDVAGPAESVLRAFGRLAPVREGEAEPLAEVEPVGAAEPPAPGRSAAAIDAPTADVAAADRDTDDTSAAADEHEDEHEDEQEDELGQHGEQDEVAAPPDVVLPTAPAVADAADADAAAVEPAPAAAAGEPVVSIPRPADGARQQRLFLNSLDESLVREATELVQSSRRATAAMLQRRLRIDYEQAMEVLALLAHRGLLELTADGTQGRIVG